MPDEHDGQVSILWNYSMDAIGCINVGEDVWPELDEENVLIHKLFL